VAAQKSELEKFAEKFGSEKLFAGLGQRTHFVEGFAGNAPQMIYDCRRRPEIGSAAADSQPGTLAQAGLSCTLRHVDLLDTCVRG
jgi:hypothetical protein